jgi:hypothetical protein
MTGAEIPLIIAMMAASTAISVSQAQSTNRRIQNQLNANAANQNLKNKSNFARTVLLTKQTGGAAALEGFKQERQAQQVRGRVQAAAAAAGLSTAGGSFARILQQTFYEEGLNKQIAGQQMEWSMEKIRSDYIAGSIDSNAAYENMVHTALSRAQNPFLSGLSGAIQGASTGLSMAYSAGQIWPGKPGGAG